MSRSTNNRSRSAGNTSTTAGNTFNLSNDDMTRIVEMLSPVITSNYDTMMRRAEELVRAQRAPEETDQARAAANMSTMVRKLERENTKRDRQSLYDKALAYFNGKYLPDFMNNAHFAHTLAGSFASFMVEDLRLASKLIADKDTVDEGLAMLDTCILNALEAQRKAEFACESFTSSATLIEPWKEAVTYRDRINAQTFTRCSPGTVWDEDAVKANAAWLKEEVKNAQSRLDIARLAFTKHSGYNNKRKAEPDNHDGPNSKKNTRKGKGGHISSASTSAVVGADNTASDE